MNKLRTGLSLLALVAMTAEAGAADLCDAGSAAALKTAAVQQELMVAGLTCNAGDAYNNFVLANRPELQKSDADLMSYFRSRDGKEDGYDSYKTKVANLAAYRSAADRTRYCMATRREFAAAMRSQSLEDFIAGDRPLIAAPEACAMKYDVPDVAVAGVPSYQLPAAPYGAPPAARAAYNNPPPAPAYARQSRSAQDQYRDWDDEAPAYGPPPGWLPPRRAPRWDWYGRSAYNDYRND